MKITDIVYFVFIILMAFSLTKSSFLSPSVLVRAGLHTHTNIKALWRTVQGLDQLFQGELGGLSF